MQNYDVFNGDADGICSLVQLRLNQPRTADLISGVKRDIALLNKISSPSAGDKITVLDVSMRSNSKPLDRALNAGAHIFYVDHHNAGDIPQHKNLLAVIDTRPEVCTGILVNKYLKGEFAAWAAVAAFGDNLAAAAYATAAPLKLGRDALSKLKMFGELLNYNSYGRDLSDLHYAPDALFLKLREFPCPMVCIENNPDLLTTLENGYHDDMRNALSAERLVESETAAALALPDAAWARRISGSLGNKLASDFPKRGHAILTPNHNNGYVVSVRAPKENFSGADQLCLQFESGGGRPGAAGINHLDTDHLEIFLSKFRAMWNH